jgi:hypothetical protein
VETTNPEALVDGLEFLLVDAHTLFDPHARGDSAVASACSSCTTRA